MSAVSPAPASQAIPLWPWGYAATGIVSLLAALTAPLASYVFMVALFGLPHVLSELRYIDERFLGRASRRPLVAISAVLSILVGLRIAEGFGLVASNVAVPVELSLGVALTAFATWSMPKRYVLGAAAGIVITGGAIFAPITTFLIFAWLHNLTPLAFISEILPKRERGRALTALSVPFIALPALVASGALQNLVHAIFGSSIVDGFSLFGAGHSPIGAFLPGGLKFPGAVTLFSAALVAQAMHYFSVIVVMPRLLQQGSSVTGAAGLVSWPSWRRFYIAIALAGAAMLAFNATDYPTARIVYSTFAAVHSWLELPVFLIALGFGFNQSSGGRNRLATIGN